MKRHKKLTAVLLIVAMIATIFATPAFAARSVTAVASDQGICKMGYPDDDGNVEVTYGDGCIYPYNINGSCYFKLRDIAALLDYGVQWNSKLKCMELYTDQYNDTGMYPTYRPPYYRKAVRSYQPLYIDGIYHGEITAYNINGNNYFKGRDLAKALNIYCDYCVGLRTMILDEWDAYGDPSMYWVLYGWDGTPYYSDNFPFDQHPDW